jgi:protein tyrosine/serine phosphatase
LNTLTQALVQVIKDTIKKGEAVMIFCKAGKDRTGLLSMLVLSVGGASDDEIVADYHKYGSARVLNSTQCQRSSAAVITATACE